MLFAMLKKVEVALRARLVQSLLLYNDALILNDPSAFDDKMKYWQNHAVLTSEIVRSSDVFIKHNLENHEGAIPVWAAVELNILIMIEPIKPLERCSNQLVFQREGGNVLSLFLQKNGTSWHKVAHLAQLFVV